MKALTTDRATVLYNNAVDGYLDKDGSFTPKLSNARIFTSEPEIKTEIRIISKRYKDVPAYNPENMVAFPVELRITI